MVRTTDRTTTYFVQPTEDGRFQVIEFRRDGESVIAEFDRYDDACHHATSCRN